MVEQEYHRVVALGIWILADRGRDDALQDIGHRLVDQVVADDGHLFGQAGVGHGRGRSVAGDRCVDARQPRVVFECSDRGCTLIGPFAQAFDGLDDFDARISLAQNPLEAFSSNLQTEVVEGRGHDHDLPAATESLAHSFATGLALKVSVRADIEQAPAGLVGDAVELRCALAEPGHDLADPVAQTRDLGGGRDVNWPGLHRDLAGEVPLGQGRQGVRQGGRVRLCQGDRGPGQSSQGPSDREHVDRPGDAPADSHPDAERRKRRAQRGARRKGHDARGQERDCQPEPGVYAASNEQDTPGEEAGQSVTGLHASSLALATGQTIGTPARQGRRRAAWLLPKQGSASWVIGRSGAELHPDLAARLRVPVRHRGPEAEHSAAAGVQSQRAVVDDAASSRKRQRALASRICRGVRARTVTSAGLATTAARQRAREVATLRRLRL